ncbi:MAG: hypothetical protein C0623_00935 [Desulfuromonas sp.]|nr:MAG: hypothetical protein C0623_00935 [Desulfuromonas sp.]
MAKGKILAIDGESFYQRFYRNTLESEGFAVRVSSSAAEAIEALRKDDFDLVVADIHLTDSEGISLIDSIRKYNQQQDILIVTGQQDVQHAVHSMKLGVSDYLLKPVNHEEFLLLVNRILYRQAVNQEHQRLIDENVEFHAILAQYRKCLDLLKVDDLDRLGDLILDTLMELLSAEGSALWLAVDGQDFLLRCRRGLARIRPNEQSFNLGDTQWQMVRSGQSRLQGEDRIVVVPLEYNGTPLGLVRIESPIGRSGFNRQDLRVSELVADFSASALNKVLQIRALEHSSLHASRDEAYSMAFFRDYAAKEFYKARRYNRQLSYVRLVVDNMDQVKSLFNQRDLDAVQSRMLDLVNAVLRDADIIAMHSDSSYSILLPETDYWGSLVTQKRIRKAIEGELKLSNMKRELNFDVFLRSSSYPADGATLEDLEAATENRLQRLRTSLFYKSNLVRLDFWSIFNRVLGRPGEVRTVDGKLIVSSDLKKFESPIRSRFIRVPAERLDEIARALCREVVEASRVRGIIYCGCADFEAMRRSLRYVDQLEKTETSFFMLGGNKRANWDMNHVVPIHIDDRNFLQNAFLLYMNEDYAYAMLARRVGDELIGFHSSDFYFVENMIAKLQEQYQLRSQI